MFSDTHFHFHHLVTERGLDGAEILSELCERKTFFAMDIGTRCGDLFERRKLIDSAISRMPEELHEKARSMVYYSAGIWPDVEEIKDRINALRTLENSIASFTSSAPGKLAAIGECGIDHHWNPSGADGRNMEDFDKDVFKGEKELFEMQLELAVKMNLPVVIHSRDAFEDTASCLDNMNAHNGIIHCFSYSKDAARAFLDRGFYIAFGGAVTYTKKSRIDEMNDLLNFVPDDRILLETDAPYLAPVPFRGKTNSPVLIEYVYNFIAAARGITPQQLSETVDSNIKTLFRI